MPIVDAILGRLMQRSLTQLPTRVRNRALHADWRAAEQALAETTPLGALPRPLLLVHGYADSPDRWQMFEGDLRRRLTNADDHLLPAADLRAPLAVAELAERIRADLHGRGIDELDIVAHSMGGLVSLKLALDGVATGLHVRRLYAIASPFAGTGIARLARLLKAPYPMQLADLRRDSALVRELQERRRPESLEIRTWQVRGDLTVPADSARALGVPHLTLLPAHWLLPDMAHIQAPQDPRIRQQLMQALVADQAC
jgi:pimeloyl-ACP methyl ester carboxylesterase